MKDRLKRSKTVITLCLTNEEANELLKHIPSDTYYMSSLIAQEAHMGTWTIVGTSHAFGMQRAFSKEAFLELGESEVE